MDPRFDLRAVWPSKRKEGEPEDVASLRLVGCYVGGDGCFWAIDGHDCDDGGSGIGHEQRVSAVSGL